MYLNIYDLSDQNSWTYWCGVGIFHSGLEAYGVEYAYGGATAAFNSAVGCLLNGISMSSTRSAGHEYDVSGVFATNPRDAPGPGRFLAIHTDFEIVVLDQTVHSDMHQHMAALN